jgi:hypothetical protein
MENGSLWILKAEIRPEPA